MILVADCGSTKIDRCLLNNGKVEKQVFTLGMNAVMLTEEEMRRRIADELAPEMDGYPVEEVYFYGAGCISPEVCSNVARAIGANLPDAKTIEVHTDLLAAARALCGRSAGIACILGTGSNSCFYDGDVIVDNVSPLGYILGDEGSGAVLGKVFLGDVLKKQLPADLCEKFLKGIRPRPHGNHTPRLQGTPGQPLPGLSHSIMLANIDRPEIHALVLNAFKAFFIRNITQYPSYANYEVNFIGSIAYYYRPVLEEAAKACGCRVGTIIKSPMEGLIKFHTA